MNSRDFISSGNGDGNHGDYNLNHGQSSQTSITAFLAKLWALVNDSSCNDLIAWDPSGASFHVYDQARFAREILPRYFKHNNFASFIRQLNMYGFRKISTIEHGSLKTERDDIEFAHPHFIRGQESLLELIKRRAPESQQKGSLSSALMASNYLDNKSSRSIELVHLLEDVRNLQTKQTSLSDKLSYLQTENEALWSEIGSLRQKHSRQQQIVSKLMEFLLQFITANSAHHQEQSVEQQTPNEVIPAHSYQPAEPEASLHPNTNPLLLNEHGLSPNSLKRKQAALMLGEQSNKRTTMQQQQHHQQHQPQFPSANNFGRQQSVTINELTDNDSTGWIPAANTTPLVDLVPSPPPAQNTDDNYQQPPNDYRWSTSTNPLVNPNISDSRNRSQQRNTTSTIGTGDNITSAHIPDFVLSTDVHNEKTKPMGQTLGTNLTGIKTSQGEPIKTNLVPKLSQQNQPYTIDESKPSPTLNSALLPENAQQNKIDPPVEQLSFSLDDITGDVDHIQSSLDNIREFMFENLPEGTSIEDLFGDDHGLLSPLLRQASNNNQAENLFVDNLQEQAPITGNNLSEQIKTPMSSQSVPNVNDQLLEQLITESAKVEEQRKTINQLEQEKAQLTDKIHTLEKKPSKTKKR